MEKTVYQAIKITNIMEEGNNELEVICINGKNDC